MSETQERTRKQDEAPGYTAECRICGWTSQTYDNAKDADEAGAEHSGYCLSGL